MAGAAPTYRRVIMLDTNAVHFTRIYLGFARLKNLEPFGPNPPDPDTTIRAYFRNRKRTSEDFRKGRRTVDYLRQETTAGSRILYSPTSQLERICSVLRGQAMLAIAKENVPYRLWTRLNEDELFDRLQPAVYRRVRSETANLIPDCATAGIIVHEADPEDMRDVWMIARELLQTLYMDMADAIVYASALLVEADEFITFDSYLRSRAAWIENPAMAPAEYQTLFKSASKQLLSTLSAAFAIPVSQIRFPKAKSI